MRKLPGRPVVTALRRSLSALLLTCLLAVSLPATVSADTAVRKLGRGMANIALGVLVVPGQVARTTRKSGPFVGATWGLVKGVGFLAATEVVGVFELITCPFETPPGYVQIMQPEFPWQYFTQREDER